MEILTTKLLPFERAVLESVGASLSGEMRERFLAQLQHINKVQRLLEWNEVEFYCMRLFKVRWPENVLFHDRAEFVLASGQLQSGTVEASVAVWAVGGHVFSLESPRSLKPFGGVSDAVFHVSKNASQQRAAGDARNARA
jgi:hypothetical protein